jgi:hypothetical protein
MKDRFPTHCQRCRAELVGSTMSRFNTEIICPECEAKERAHPDYPRARDAEAYAVRNGNYNFPGIGKPADL